ncbi:hypothetical protein, partial [Streptomyces venezuelae]|uniref:hypothetical protein n=1 Tax=Streptomyces venezuelae TaxID=54571 RepID=UPI001F376E56
MLCTLFALFLFLFMFVFFFFFFLKKKRAYEMGARLGGWEMVIRDRGGGGAGEGAVRQASRRAGGVT